MYPNDTLLKKNNDFIVVVMNVYFRSILIVVKQEQGHIGFKFKHFQEQRG